MNKAAVIQMVSQNDVAKNLEQAQSLIREATHQGAKLVVLPENFAFMGKTEDDKCAHAESLGEGPIQTFLSDTAKEYAITLVGGTIPLKSAESKRVYAASLVYNEQGQQQAHYNKIHLFDIDVPGKKESYRESAATIPGEKTVATPTPLGTLGLSVCYDLRFPELYRDLSKQGAQMLTVPSAFTKSTGLAHWEILIRARAIENLAFVLAPNQGGIHNGIRETFGHSMIVDPWGRVLACRDSGPAVLVANIDLSDQATMREQFPALSHRKM